MEYSEIAQMAVGIRENVGRVIIGKSGEIELILAAMLSGGHILLEDVPGTGKTTMAKALSRSLDCRFSRVQFTPDLLPADITGTRIFNQKTGEFSFVKGPVFTNILLADEINRATPRTQSALLECMEEQQITEGSCTYALERPFLVIATQNPVETQGTFPLPEAQLDRFLIKLSLGYPDRQEALQMLQRFADSQPLEQLEAVASGEQICQAAALCRTCYVSTDLMEYMAHLCEAARDPSLVRLGPSPRALLGLMRCTQAMAAIRGRDYVIPDDVKAVALPVLAHRILMRGFQSTLTPEAFLQELLTRIPVPAES